jgi:AcrR family transcriptional regulator
MTDVGIRRSELIGQIGGVFRARGYEGATLTHLAAATGLGKASLYHHFPGGKTEMADVLLREAVAQAERLAFSRLKGADAPGDRLQRFIAGFADYLEQNDGTCLLGVLALGSDREAHRQQITAQFRDWQASLARTFEEAGHKPKRAIRAASELLNLLYGAQAVSKLLNDPQHLRRTLKRLLRGLDKTP